jgi:hypothetical protein
MSKRWLPGAVMVSTLAATLITGCSSGKTTTAPTSDHPASSGKSSASSTGPSATETPVIPLLSSECVAVTEANADLLATSDKDAARNAANTLEGYNPPAPVKDAIEHFVGTGGAHFDDPDYAKNHKILDDWVKAVCPK